MKKNIIFDHQIFSVQRYGGISRYFFEIAKNINLLDDTFEVKILAPLYVNEYLHKEDGDGISGRKVRQMRRTGHLMRWLNNTLSVIILRFFNHVDIFHETYYSRNKNCPQASKRVITVYDMIHEKFPEMFSDSDKTRELKAIAVRRADHIICISENTRRDLIDLLGVPREKTSVIYLGYSLSAEMPVSIITEVTKPYLLYVGQRAGYKNFEALLRAYCSSGALRAKFDIVCFGGGDFTAREISLVEELNFPLSAFHSVVGDDSMLAGLYKQAAVFVYPSLYEGFGIPPLEAMSYGCPVVCANTSSLPEVVGDAAEFFDPLNITDMSFAIERVVFSTERASELVAKGRQRLSHFSWEKCAGDTLEVYKKVLRGNSA